MNKIYRLVWNKETGRMVVASELATSDAGSGGSVDARRKVTRRTQLALAVLAGLWGGGAWAADAVCVDPANPTVAVGTTPGAGNEVACGNGANASGANAVAVGNASTASGNNTVAVGNWTNATGPNSIAIGTGRQATQLTTSAGAESIALGFYARALGTRSIAQGAYAVAGDYSIAMGDQADATQVNTVAIGRSAYTGQFATQVGYGSAAFAGGFHGAFRRGSTLVGYEANSGGVFSTVTGANSSILANQNIKVGALPPF